MCLEGDKKNEIVRFAEMGTGFFQIRRKRAISVNIEYLSSGMDRQNEEVLK